MRESTREEGNTDLTDPAHGFPSQQSVIQLVAELVAHPRVAPDGGAQLDDGANIPGTIHGWYNLMGGGAGFLLVESDDPREVAAFLMPYLDLMDVDVHGIYERPYEETITACVRPSRPPGKRGPPTTETG